MKALPTWYAGFHFRSRLEARWAVFFVHAGVKFMYEPEGIESDNRTRYLPDFFLPELDMVIEVKGVDVTRTHINKLAMACEWYSPPMSERVPSGIYTTGVILQEIPYRIEDMPSWDIYNCEGLMDTNYSWCECPLCGYVGFEFDGFAGRLPCECERDSDRIPSWGTDKLINAYRAATSARFGT